MFQEIMSLALGNGLWAAMFCLLFLYQLKDSRSREARYSAAIESLTQSLSSVKDIKEDCVEISMTMRAVKADCEAIKSDCTVIKSGIRSVKRGAKKKEKPAENTDTATLPDVEKEQLAAVDNTAEGGH